jgi:hypothetical protein
MIEIFPIAIEGYDETNEGVFKIKAFDECAAEIEITTMVNPYVWPEISEAIMKSLQMMYPAESSE